MSRLFLYVRWWIPVRFSLLGGLGPAALLVLAAGPGKRLLWSLFVLDGPAELVHVTWLSLLISATVLVSFRVTRLNIPARLDDFASAPAGPLELVTDAPVPWRLRWLWWLLLGWPVPAFCAVATLRDPGPGWREAPVWPALAAIGGGSLLALAGLAAVAVLQQWLLSPHAPSPGLLPFEQRGWMKRIKGLRLPWLHRKREREASARRRRWPGYLNWTWQEERDRYVLTWGPGHVQMTVLLLVVFLGYLASYLWGTLTGWTPGSETPFPALFFLLLAWLLVLCLLPGLAFFLDRYRFPVSIGLVMVMVLVYTLRPMDHYFHLPLADVDSRRDVEIVSWMRQRDVPGEPGSRTLVVVTASGGGIQSAAWTAQVLTGLHERYGDPFSRSVSMMSCVSGGSVGAWMYLVHREELRPDYEAGEPVLTAASLERIRRMSQSSALDATAWGFAYPEITRLFIPSNRYVDRGWAIEGAWTRMVRESVGEERAELTLRGLQVAMTSRGLPAVVFHGTLVETGQRWIMSPLLGQNEAGGRSFEAPREFLEMYPDRDLRLSTAVRLSATFPYVSPICRSGEMELDEARFRYHFADGGYADNEGVVTAIEWCTRWLEDARDRPASERPFDRILLIRIRAFPVPESLEPSGREPGWLHAVFGPVTTMMNVRGTSQTERGNLEVDLLARLSQEAGADGISFDSVEIEFPRPSDDGTDWIPLSWKLTPSQQLAIGDAWRRLELDAEAQPQHPLAVIDRYFDRVPAATEP